MKNIGFIPLYVTKTKIPNLIHSEVSTYIFLSIVRTNDVVEIIGFTKT